MSLDQSNARRIVEALTDFGFGSLGLSIVQLGYPPHRIDIITSIDAVDFDDAWGRRLTIEVDGRPLDFIGRDDLVRNKLAVGRPPNLADVDRLRLDGAS